MLEVLLGGEHTPPLVLPSVTGPGPTELVGSYQRSASEIAGFYGAVSGSVLVVRVRLQISV